MEINKSKLTTTVRWKVHTNLRFHILIFVSQSMQYDILWFVVYVPKRRHLLHQVPFPSCSYPHWISSATNNNPTKMIFGVNDNVIFLLLQPNFSKTIELGKLFGIAKPTFGTFAQITKDDMICQHFDIFTFICIYLEISFDY